MPTIDLIAISYFNSDCLPRLVESLLAQTTPDWRLWTVDNSEDSAEFDALADLATVDRRVAAVRAPRNLGYFGAAQWFLERHRPEADWTVVANSDLYLGGPDALEYLGDPGSEVGVITPALSRGPGHPALPPGMAQRPSAASMRGSVLSHWLRSTPVGGWLHRVGARWTDRPRPVAPTPAGPRVVYRPVGSFIAFSQTYFRLGGNLIHPTFLYGEEINVAEQCRRLGLRVLYQPRLVVVHHRGRSTSLLPPAFVRQCRREGMRYSHQLIAGRRRPGEL